MGFARSLSIFFSFSFGLFFTFTFTHATTFDVLNQCPYTVWAAAYPLGGWQLTTGESWSFTVKPDTRMSRIWGRTNCNSNANGRTKCETGDCNGILECQNTGKPPLTLAEFKLSAIPNLDFMDISLVNGFNIPMNISPSTNSCSGLQCAADITAQCPEDLQAPGGCYSACKVFKTSEYCCDEASEKCRPTEYSRFFKKMCPNAYSYVLDDETSTFTCPTGTDYKVVFCP